jgi:hypothetical protein
MVSEGLIAFMRKNFGSQCLKILNVVHQRLGIEDIEEASLDDKKNFILEMQPILRDKNLLEGEILISELMELLNVNSSHAVYSSIGIQRSTRDLIRNYIALHGEKRINTCYEEMNSLVKLYLQNTESALKKGISKSSIQTMTKKVLQGLKEKLFSIRKDIEDTYNIRTNKEFVQKRLKDLDYRGEFYNEQEVQNQLNIILALEKYEARIEKIYGNYHNTFLKNLEKKLYLEESKIPENHLVKRTAELSENVYQQIQVAFQGLKNDLQSEQ